MNLETILAGMQEKANKLDPIKATLKLAVGDLNIYVDGTGDTNVNTQEDKEADCVIKKRLIKI